MTLPVFVADPGVLLDAAPGTRVALDGPEGRHAVSVQRLRVGEGVDLVDGGGLRVRGTVAATSGKERLEVDVTSTWREDSPPVRLALVQALAKGGRDEQAVESAVEIGADRIVPWQAERCVARWEGPKVAKGREKWRATVLAATKQSRRAFLPEVDAPVATPDLARWVQATCSAGGAVLVLHEEASVPLGAVAGDLAVAGNAVVAVVVGPEGGITPREVTALEDAGARTVRLGPHVLRSSTAGPVALTLLAERLGVWDAGYPSDSGADA